MGRNRPAKQKARCLLALFARFFLGFGVNGCGGVFSIRRGTSSALGCVGSRLFACAVVNSGRAPYLRQSDADL